MTFYTIFPPCGDRFVIEADGYEYNNLTDVYDFYTFNEMSKIAIAHVPTTYAIVKSKYVV